MRLLKHLSKFSMVVGLMLSQEIHAATNTQFECVISADRTNYSLGETPSFSIRIINKSPSEALLVGALDGSCVGWRYPKCNIEILDDPGEQVTSNIGRCGNMSTLRVEDFVLVSPGKGFDPVAEGFFKPYEFHKFPVNKSGAYRVRFYYSTDAKKIEEFYGDERRGGQGASSEINRLIQRVPKLDLKSNELTLVFK